MLRNAFVAAVLVPVASVALLAQAPRMVLFEEMSNASCGPCAAQNPTYHAFITQNPERILPISFRSAYPGRDVMHDEDAAMHDGRVTYYGTPGVPHVRINGLNAPPSPGWYAGGAADTVAQSKYLPTIATMSPITITAVEARNGNNSDITVNVTSTESLDGKVLRIAVVEAHHYYASAGGNGEKDFYNVVRKMLPSLTGTPLTVGAGATQTVTASYTVDPAKWNLDQMYVIAFVQDDATKEVLQAAASVQRPTLQLDVAGSPVVLQPTPAQEAWSGTVKTNVSGDYTVTIDKKLPSGWSGSVKIAGTDVTTGQKVAITGGVDAAIDAIILPSATRAGSGRITVELSNGHQEVSKTFRLFAGKADLAVLVRDEGVAAIADKYDEALGLGQRSYVILDKGVEPMFNLGDFQVVVMEVGKNVFTQAEATTVKSYLDGGGRMMLSGAEITWGMVDSQAQASGYYADAGFVRDYLHAKYLADGTSTLTTVTGVAGDPITDGLNVKINTGVANQDTPDEIAPLGNALRTCGYNDGKGAGLRFADERYRLVYFGFGMEGIGNAQQRASLVEKSITWLLGNEMTVAGVAEASSLNGVSIAIAPNPARTSVAIPITLPHAMRASIAVYDVRGVLVTTIASRTFDAGTTTLRYDASALANGVYAITMVTPMGRVVKMLTVAR